MKELRFLQAMNDIDEEYLLEAERACARRPRLLPRIAAVAAIVALLTVGVYAAVAGITLSFQPDEVKFTYEGVDYSPMSMEYDLGAVSVPQDAMDAMTIQLTDSIAWSKSSFTTLPYEHGLRSLNSSDEPVGVDVFEFSTVAEVEDYLALSLHLPELFRKEDLQIDFSVLSNRISDNWEDAVGAFWGMEVEDFSVGGAKLLIKSAEPTEEICHLNAHILLAFTDSFAEENYHLGLYTPQDILGEAQVEELRTENGIVTLVSYPANEYHGGVFHALYTSGGIGYHISGEIAMDSGVAHPRDILLPLLESMT